MDGGRLAGFVVLAALLAFAPGADVALVTRSAISGGRRHARLSSLGVAAGCIVWAVASAAGVAAVLEASAELYRALRLAGALYLIWLGIGALRDARSHLRATVGVEGAPAGAPEPAAGSRGAFLRGVTSNVLNPKVGLFYLAVVPQFVPQGGDVLVWWAVLSGIHIAIGLAWLLTYSELVSRLAGLIRRRRVRAGIEAATGTTMLGFGAAILLEE